MDFRTTFIPLILDHITAIPIPRIEYRDNDYDVVVENLVLNSPSFVPNLIELEASVIEISALEMRLCFVCNVLDDTDLIIFYRIVISFRYTTLMKFAINGNIALRSMLKAFMQKHKKFAFIIRRRRDFLILRTMVP